MPTRKIRDLEKHEQCTHPEHSPPMWRVFTPGVYEHICPSCGHRTEFTVRGSYWTNPTPRWPSSPKTQWVSDVSRSRR